MNRTYTQLALDGNRTIIHPKAIKQTSNSHQIDIKQVSYTSFLPVPEQPYLNYVSINPTYTCLFHKNEKKRLPLQYNLMSMSNLQKTKFTGSLSKHSEKRIKSILAWLLEFSKEKELKSLKSNWTGKFNINLITLDLPSTQRHSDNIIKKECLNQFLVEARKKWGLNHYLWRVEKQKNGNIHFHITSDCLVPHTELREVWNRITEKLGYVSEYRQNQKEFHKNGFNLRKELLHHWSATNQRRAYREGVKSDWSFPNSTDVHAVKKIKNIGAYLCKYMSKKQDEQLIEGRIWGCSYALSQVRPMVVEAVDCFWNGLKNTVEELGNDIKENHYYSTINRGYNQIKHIFKSGINYLFDDWVDYYRTLRPT